jgi:hypothetical protein
MDIEGFSYGHEDEHEQGSGYHTHKNVILVLYDGDGIAHDDCANGE